MGWARWICLTHLAGQIKSALELAHEIDLFINASDHERTDESLNNVKPAHVHEGRLYKVLFGGNKSNNGRILKGGS